jgi:crotonobetainyl-CoA:carnitine CoA-transferase CaiB-like acyl-CoA transferase
MRQLPPLVNGRGVYDLLLNRGKRSVVLDLREADARASLDRLIARADVVIESFRPSTAKRLGVSAAEIRAKHSRVIHCSITGYGQTGPYAERPGHDLNYVSISGMIAADRPDPTQLPHIFIADIGGGAMSAVIGILAALVGRGRDGEGRAIDISMHEAALYWVMLPAARELVDGGREAIDELPTFGRHACYNVYRTKDAQLVALGALELKFWRAFCEAVARPDLTPRHLSDPVDQTRLLSEVRQIFLTRTREEWLAFFRGHDVCLTPVNSPADALRDPHIAARGVVQAVPGGRAILPPFTTKTPDLLPAPTLGQHTDDVLKGCGS